MRAITRVVDGIIERACREANKSRVKYDDEKRFDRRQRAIARHFGVTYEQLSELTGHEQESAGIDTNNMVVSLMDFLEKEAEILEIGNYEPDFIRDLPVPSPVFRELEISSGVFKEIWKECTVFFRWNGEVFYFGIKAQRSGPGTRVQFVSKDRNTLHRFLGTIREYQKKHHYLRGKKFIGMEGRIMPTSDYEWKDILLPNGLAETVRSEVTGLLKCVKALDSYRLNSKKGFILAGDPGNGKTLLLKILANTTDATCMLLPFKAPGPEGVSLSKVFRLARTLAPTILILEDIDLYGEDRGHVRDGSFLGDLMNELDGMVDNREIIVIATTNHLEKVENALRNRPGRFDRVYKIPNPDLQARRNLLGHFIGRIPNAVPPAEVDRLAEMFSGYSGAYLKELVNSGFAQSIMRDPLSPVLTVEDLDSCVGVLKSNEKRSSLGFSAVHQRAHQGSMGAGESVR